MSKTDHVLVVGAGVAGLTAATCLNMAGIRATVYEAQPEHVDAGASFAIGEHGQRVLARIGLLEEVRRHSMPMPERFFTVGGPSGKEIEYTPMDTDIGQSMEHRCIDRSTFIRILLAEARRRGVEIVYGKRLHQLDQQPESVVATFTDGSRAEGDLLIGAEGRGSITRSLIFPHARLQHAQGWSIYGRAETHGLEESLKAELERGSSLMYHAGDLMCLAYRDDPLNASQITWLLMGRSTRKIPAKSFELLDQDTLLKQLNEGLRPHPPLIADIVAASTRIAPTQVFHLPPLPAWSQGRVALIGDAVHAADPLTGFGTTFALEDGMYVAKMLREHHYIDAFYYLHADRHENAEKINTHIDPERDYSKLDYEDMQSGYATMASYHFDLDWDLSDHRPMNTLLDVPAP
ncbi:FAD-dependent oxidoreductase [Streptomyces sp. NPDC057474]|uniref:FAD-dependent oxidoreductase n=1 Tax=Streptomyces sp. NPDC057474 TaxID=3346144 RepID=UPI0036C33903